MQRSRMWSVLHSVLLWAGLLLATSSATARAEDCIDVDPDNLTIELLPQLSIWSLTDGASRILSFELHQLVEALRAAEIIETYGLNEYCFVGRPNPPMEYWRVDGWTPIGNRLADEDCLHIGSPEVQYVNGEYKMVDGSHWILGFGQSQSEAEEAVGYVQKYDFTHICYVGRPFASMVYWKSMTDRDGDGILDHWEVHGLDADGDGVVDVDFPAFGADPDHKDLFVELDWMAGREPTREMVQTLKETFAAAPLDAGGTFNPDNQLGINLWVDTGNLSDPSAAEDGGAVGSFSDGIDNGGDGSKDGADPDCLVGDDLGGGNRIPTTEVLKLSSDAFYDTKERQFDQDRRAVFRYGISATPVSNGKAGQGELGGNDFIVWNNTSVGVMLHELGHTLNLHHGGDEEHNCKPNYLSVMSYTQSRGIWQNDGNRLFDFSPPRTTGGRANAPLPRLYESDLDETSPLDPDDPVNQIVFVNGQGDLVRSSVNRPVDWNGDGLRNDPSAMVNIDTSSPDGWPEACENDSTSDLLHGHHDWDAITLNFRSFGNYTDGPINPVAEDTEPSESELALLEQALHTTDLAVDGTLGAQDLGLGDRTTVTVTLGNLGPNPATAPRLLADVPVGLEVVDPGTCIVDGSWLDCELEEIEVGEPSVELTFHVRVVAEGTHTLALEARNFDYDDKSPTDNLWLGTVSVIRAEGGPPTAGGEDTGSAVGDSSDESRRRGRCQHGSTAPASMGMLVAMALLLGRRRASV